MTMLDADALDNPSKGLWTVWAATAEPRCPQAISTVTDLSDATVYRRIDDLLELGLIEEVDTYPQVAGGRPTSIYQRRHQTLTLRSRNGDLVIDGTERPDVPDHLLNDA